MKKKKQANFGETIQNMCTFLEEDPFSKQQYDSQMVINENIIVIWLRFGSGMPGAS